MPNGLTPEEMGISKEDMETPEQREKERARKAVEDIVVAGYSDVPDPDRLKKAADFVTERSIAELDGLGVEIPTDYLEGVKAIIAEISSREGIEIGLSKEIIEEVILAVESGDAAALYVTMADRGRPGKERGKGVQLDPEKDGAIFEAASKIFQARDGSAENTANLMQLIGTKKKYVGEYRQIVAEQEKLNLKYEEFFSNGAADSYLESVGFLPVEAALEASGDNRVWTDLSEDEKANLRQLVSAYAKSKGRTVEEDETSCMVV